MEKIIFQIHARHACWKHNRICKYASVNKHTNMPKDQMQDIKIEGDRERKVLAIYLFN